MTRILNTRLLKTIAVFSVNICLACGCSILGPTLVSMGYLLKTDTFHMSLALGGMRLGFLIGTLLCGLLYTRLPFKAELQFALGCTVIAFAMGTAPWLPNIYAFLAVILFMGTGCGYVDAGSQPFLINLWHGHKLRNSLLQALHFNWSVTATIAPYIISLFLVDIPHNRNSGNHHNLSGSTNLDSTKNHQTNLEKTKSQLNLSYDSNDHPILLGHKLELDKNQSDIDVLHLIHTQDVDYGRVRWSFVLLSVLCSVMTCFIFIVYFHTRKEKQEIATQSHSEESSQSDEKDQLEVEIEIIESKKRPTAYTFLLLTFLFLYAFLYQCIEGIPGGFLTVFCAEGLGWHLDQGAILTTVFWGMLGIGRLSSILMAWTVAPRIQIIINLTFLGIGYFLLQFVLKLGHVSMWICMALVGLGLGSSLPSSFLWMTDYMPMTSSVSTTAIAGNSLAGVVILPLTGYLFDTQGPMCIVYMLGVYGLCFIIVFICMQLWASYGMKMMANGSESMASSTESSEESKSLNNF